MDTVKSMSVVLTEPYVDMATGQTVISACVPVAPGGKLTGVFGGDFSLSALISQIKAANLGGIGRPSWCPPTARSSSIPTTSWLASRWAEAYPV